MRNKKALLAVVSFLFSVVMMFSVMGVAFATADPYNPDEEVSSEPIYTEEVTEPPTDEPTEEATEPPTEEESEEQTEETSESEEYYEDETLPQVEDVTKPTEEEFPEYEISDISLLGGVISWLCVAVGIAVIAGVLVSQRTKQVSGHRDNRRR